MSERSILLTGATGQVGGHLLRTLAPFGKLVAPPRAELDLYKPDQVRKFVRNLRPQWIVNTGAYTAVDRAETESALAFAANVESVAVLGEQACATGAVVIHFSTDYVFSGRGSVAWRETDPTGPLNIYGTSKLRGEQALVSSGAAHIIFRTSWVYGATGNNFLLTILKLAREREVLRIVADQHGAPTSSSDLAALVAEVIKQTELRNAEGGSLADAVKPFSGVYHAASRGETTWYGFAVEAIRQMREREPGTKFADIQAITTAEFPTPAARPCNSRLNCTLLLLAFQWTMPLWTDSLSSILRQLSDPLIP